MASILNTVGLTDKVKKSEQKLDGDKRKIFCDEYSKDRDLAVQRPKVITCLVCAQESSEVREVRAE